MGLLKIDQSKCKKDGLCVQDCPAAIIRLSEDDGYPAMVPEGETLCLVCGHCVAVCPHGALSHGQVPIESSPPIDDAQKVTPEQAVQFLRSRRSIRFYQDKPVEREKIERLIEVARYAPTGGNSQLVEWLVLSNRSEIHKIAGLAVEWLRQFLQGNPRVAEAVPYLPRTVAAWDAGYDSLLRNAPVLIVASAPMEAVNGMVDLALSLSYLDLLAPTMGLGTCWAGLLQGPLLASPPIKEALGIPMKHPHHYPMMVGYPAVKYFRVPERKPPRITFK
jgi:nitroreductase/NAD-dependent dihydropyrimidine dehydrogenase PreA subunit